MRKTILLSAAMAGLMMTACSNDESATIAHSDVALNITGGITSRAVDNQWESNDNIGVLMLNTGTSTASEKTQYKYTTSKGNGSFAPASEAETAYFPTGNATVDVLAYYPHDAKLTADYKLTVNTADQNDLSAIDLMAASKVTGVNAKNPDVALDFDHKLSKVVITVDREASANDVDLTGAKLTLSGTAATATYSLLDGTLALGAKADIALASSVKDGVLSAKGIVIPTAAGQGVKLIVSTAAGKTFTAELPGTDALAAGTENTLRMHLTQTAAKLTATVQPWTTGVEASMSSINIAITAPDGTDPGFEQMQIWEGNAADNKVTYTNAEGKFTATTPFYLENYTDAGKFYAMHTPADAAKDAVTGLKDVLAAGPASLDGGALAFTMNHLLAKMRITMTAGAGLPASIDLTKAVLSVKNIVGNYTIDGIALTAGTTKETYAPSVAQAAAGMICVPQTITAGTAIATITAGGHTYSISATADINLEAGKITTLAVTVNPTAAKASATVTAWAVGGTASEVVTVDGLTTGTTGSTTIPAGSLALASGKQTATYIYNGSAWSTTAPIYWDALPLAASTDFYGILTPDAAASAGSVKDYLAGNASTAFGAPINMEMGHAMSQINITLKAGVGYAATPSAPTAAENSAMIEKMTSRAIMLKALSGIAPGNSSATAKTGIVTLGSYASITGTTAFADGTTYTVAPQALTNDAKIVMAIANGNTYTVKFSDISVNGNKITALEAGKSYSITLTVNETAVGISATIAPWSAVNGEGTMKPDVE